MQGRKKKGKPLLALLIQLWVFDGDRRAIVVFIKAGVYPRTHAEVNILQG